MSDDGLKVPPGYEIERWPDGSPKMIDGSRCRDSQFWISDHGAIEHGKEAANNPMNGYWRIALRKLPEPRKLLDFRGAIAAHRNQKVVKCAGEDGFHWDPCRIYPQTVGLNDIPLEWMIDRVDFYAEDPT